MEIIKNKKLFELYDNAQSYKKLFNNNFYNYDNAENYLYMIICSTMIYISIYSTILRIFDFKANIKDFIFGLLFTICLIILYNFYCNFNEINKYLESQNNIYILKNIPKLNNTNKSHTLKKNLNKCEDVSNNKICENESNKKICEDVCIDESNNNKICEDECEDESNNKIYINDCDIK